MEESGPIDNVVHLPGTSSQAAPMTGTPNQVELAKEIKPKVKEEFDRVAKALGEVAAKQSEEAQAYTRELIALLQEKQAEVMAKEEAAYFIREWQEMDAKVRGLLAADERYQTIQAERKKRKL
jgi:hypothetical protein